MGSVALASWFITLFVMRLAHLATADPFSDSTLYLRGTAAWLRGDDPWSVHMTTLYYAAAPPSLLPMVPFAILPEALGLAVLLILSLAASFWTLRRLGLPWWWITWPPLVDNLWNGNPQLFLVPLLLGPVAWFAPIVKAYAIVPLLIQFRFRAVALTAMFGLVTLPLLPWGLFLTRLSETSTLLSEQSQGGMSAWFFPVLVPFAAIALLVMGRERASWWAIPALWPSTQWYYSLMAMPALTPLTAAILAAPVQGGPAVAAVGRARGAVARAADAIRNECIVGLESGTSRQRRRFCGCQFTSPLGAARRDRGGRPCANGHRGRGVLVELIAATSGITSSQGRVTRTAALRTHREG